MWTNFVLLKKLKKRVYEHFIGCRWPNSTLSYSLFFLKSRRNLPFPFNFRDRPFNLKGGGGYGFFFVSFRNCFSDNTRVGILIFFVAQSANFFHRILHYVICKSSESDYFFFLHQNQNIFFSNIGNQNIFSEKKHNPPPL